MKEIEAVGCIKNKKIYLGDVPEQIHFNVTISQIENQIIKKVVTSSAQVSMYCTTTAINDESTAIEDKEKNKIIFEAESNSPVMNRLKLQNELCIVSQVKNEAEANLVEFIQYHYLLGFTRFIFFDNNSTKKAKTFKTLRKMYAYGVFIIPFPYFGMQRVVSVFGQILTRRMCDFTFFIDVDEYIMPLFGNQTVSLSKLLQKRVGKNPYISQIAFCERKYGHFKGMDLIKRPYNSIITEYTKAHTSTCSDNQKVALRPNGNFLTHAVHYSITRKNFTSVTISYCGNEAFSRHECPRINHYKQQSWEDFYRRFEGRGPGNRWNNKGISRDKVPPDWGLTNLGYEANFKNFFNFSSQQDLKSQEFRNDLYKNCNLTFKYPVVIDIFSPYR